MVSVSYIGSPRGNNKIMRSLNMNYGNYEECEKLLSFNKINFLK